MNTFTINGIQWQILFVKPNSSELYRSDNTLTVGVTDFETRCVYLSNVLHGSFLEKVTCHELVHCFMFSYNIHISIEQEEFMADWFSVYGKDLVYLLDNLMNGFVSGVAL